MKIFIALQFYIFFFNTSKSYTKRIIIIAELNICDGIGTEIFIIILSHEEITEIMRYSCLTKRMRVMQII